MIVVSPHLDDGVLSLGGWLATQPKFSCTIVTVCAGFPPNQVTSYDERSGFTDSTQAVTARRDEDRLAIESLNQQHWWLPFLDSQYGTPLDAHTVAAHLVETFHFADRVYVPLGLMHPDHIATASACREAADLLGIHELYVYEDLPSTHLWPESARAARKVWETHGWRMRPVEILTNLRRKHVAVTLYASQRTFTELAFINLAEERLWRAWNSSTSDAVQ